MSTDTSIHRPTVADIALEHAALDLIDLGDRVRDLEADVAIYRAIAHEALAVVVQRDRTIRHLRDDVAHLRAQVRAAVSGRTVAAERQAIDREALDRGHGHDADEADEADDEAHGARMAA